MYQGIFLNFINQNIFNYNNYPPPQIQYVVQDPILYEDNCLLQKDNQRLFYQKKELERQLINMRYKKEEEKRALIKRYEDKIETQNINLEMQNNKLKKLIENHSRTKSEQRNNNNQTKNDYDLNRIINEQNNKIKDLNNKINNLQKQQNLNKETTKEKDKSTKETNIKQENDNNNNIYINELIKKNNQMEKKLKEMQNQLNNNEKIREENQNQLKKEIIKEKNKNKDLLNKIEKQNNLIKNNNKIIFENKNELNNLNNKISKISKRNNTQEILNKQKEEIEKQNKELKQQINNLIEQNREKIEKEKQKLIKDFSEKEKQQTSKNEEITLKLKQKLSLLDKRSKDFENKLIEEKSKLEKRNEELEKQRKKEIETIQTQLKNTENNYKQKEKSLLEQIKNIDNEMKNQKLKAEEEKKNYEESVKKKEIDFEKKLEQERAIYNEKYNNLLNEIKIQAENSKKNENYNRKIYNENLEKQKNKFLKEIKDTKDEMEKKIIEEKLKEKQEIEKLENEAFEIFEKDKNELIVKQKQIFSEEFIKKKENFCLEEINQVNKNQLKNLINELNKSEQIPTLILKKLTEQALKYYANNKFNEIKHLNIIVIGPSGVGKSTLINEILELSGEEAAKTESGKPCTNKNKIYYSEDIKLRLIDTRGIEKGIYGVDKVVENTINYIDNCIKIGDPDKFVHCIWYCVNGNRFEDIEMECLNKLSEFYNNNNLPIIVVYTRAIEKEHYNKIGEIIEKSGKGFGYIYVIAKTISTEIGLMKPINLEELKKMSIEKSSNAIESACFTSLKKIIIDKINNEIKINLKQINKFITEEIDKIKFIKNEVSCNQINDLTTKIAYEIIKKYLKINEENILTDGGMLMIKNFIKNYFLESKRIYINCLETIINEKATIISQKIISLQNNINSKCKGNLKIFNTEEDYKKIIKNELFKEIKANAEFYCLKNASKYIIEKIKLNFLKNYEIASHLALRSNEMNQIFELITKNELNKLKRYV